MEIILDVNVSQLTERQKGMFIRQIGVLLGVLDSDITVQKIQPYTEQRWDSSGRVHGEEWNEGLENQGLLESRLDHRNVWSCCLTLIFLLGSELPSRS